MALKFASIDIPGLHGPVVAPSPEHSARTVKFLHVAGEGEIVGRPAGRTLVVRVLLFDSYTEVSQLQEFLEKLADKVGENDTLEVTGTIPDKFDYCTFLGYEPLPLDGQGDPGPLLDIAGTLEQDDDNQPVHGWFIQLLLKFRQLRVD